ncbi:MAG: methyltransferase domain-containing protein [Solirubrobacteraceae bacterium]
MWGVDGAIAFAAEDHGARAVTGLDLMGPSDTFAAEHARRSSRVRFIQGDLHDAGVMEQVGRHDVVWCSGVIYHSAPGADAGAAACDHRGDVDPGQ